MNSDPSRPKDPPPSLSLDQQSTFISGNLDKKVKDVQDFYSDDEFGDDSEQTINDDLFDEYDNIDWADNVKNAADIILVDDNFANIVHGVEAAKNIFRMLSITQSLFCKNNCYVHELSRKMITFFTKKQWE